MPREKRERDLFGNVIRTKKPRLQTALEKYDRDTLRERLDRLQFLQAFYPKKYWFAMTVESASIFGEARMAFINGEYISTILLAVCFAEHWLGGFLQTKGYARRSYSSLVIIINTLKRNELVSDYILSRLDRLRQIRNPFVHIKEIDHPNKLERRLIIEGLPPHELLEKDAKEALSLMYQIAIAPSNP